MIEYQQLIKLRTKKLGVLIYDARLAARRSLEKSAAAIGISTGQLKSYENGQRAPSLPELEELAFFLNVPVEHFWDNQSLTQKLNAAPRNNEQLRQLRDRIIGARLRLARNQAGLSMAQVSKMTSLPVGRIKRFELAQTPIPLPELEVLTEVLKLEIDELFDQQGLIADWRSRQEQIKQFLELPDEVQQFVVKPVNRPFLDLAQRLSHLPVEKLRKVAEGLLEITY